jgi:spore germination cell wall hydrolase CwlJ-like protein
MTQAITLKRPFQGLKDQAAQVKLRAAGLWRSNPRETVGAGLLGVIVAVALGTAASSFPETSAEPAAPPAPPPLLIRQIAPEQAVKVNAAIPVAEGPNPAAQPFAFKGNQAAREQALQCLASAVYYEAGREPTDGQRGVAQVVLNRVRHSAFPGSVCGVVYQGSTRATGCQFSFTCDGSLYRQPDAVHWKRAYQVAQAALSGAVHEPVGNATHYHANYVVPYWASSLNKNAVIGAHIFYRWNGGWGQPAAFGKTYAGREPNMAALRSAALAAEAATANLAQGTVTPATVAEAIEEIPGAEPLPLVPSMRGDKRVAVRFKLAAREATEKLEPKEYVQKVQASDNLKWALSGEPTAAAEKPLGKTAEAPAASGSSGATGQR